MSLLLQKEKGGSRVSRRLLLVKANTHCVSYPQCIRRRVAGTLRCVHHRVRQCPTTKHSKEERSNYAEKRRRELIRLKREKGPCVDCGIDDLRVLEFDHVVAHLKCGLVGKRPLRDMASEAGKCVMRCRRCHRIKSEKQCKEKYQNHVYSEASAVRQQRRYSKKAQMVEAKKSIGKCEKCGWFNGEYTCAMDFDHLHPADKFVRISRMVNQCYSWENIQTEINKCQLLCANCHHIKTLRERRVTLYEDYAP